jgi:peptide chain release factor subunit 1
MVTMIIPPDTNLDDVRHEIKQESNTANNIKNNTNRKSVQQALSSLSSYIKKMKRLPDTGVALFAEQYV